MRRAVAQLLGITLVVIGLGLLATGPSQARTFTGKVKIAAVQTSPVLGDKAGNLADMQARTRQAAAEGADLVVFPELSLTGYKYRSIAEMAPDAEPVPGPSTMAMAATARESGAYIVFGMVEEDAGKFYDSVVLVGPEGYVGKYAKITMGHESEAVLFTRGPSAPPVFDTSIGRIGLASCYDGAFPENARMMGLEGAQIMVLIDAENGTTWRDYVRTRAVENNAFAVVANRVGSERNSTFNGYSLIADPNYDLLANASTDQVETISATVDLGETSNKFVGERRPELYRDLTRTLPARVLGVNAEPQSAVAGTATGVDVLVATGGIKAGSGLTATVATEDGTTIATASGTVGVDQARLALEIPADASPGTHTLRVAAAGSEKTLPFTVKDVAKPGPLGVMPAAGASLASTVYIGFDTELAPDADIPVTITGGGTTRTVTGRVNTTAIDNRVTAPYTGLSAGTDYQVSLPAGSVADADSGAVNDAFRFDFTTAPAARTTVAAVGQVDIVPHDVDANVEAIRAAMQSAAAEGVKLLVLPELTVTGSTFSSREQALGVAEELDGPSVAAISAEAAELGMTVSFGLAEKAGSKIFATNVLLGPDGLIGSHRSTHLADDQVDIFDAGDRVAEVHDTAVGPIGLVSGYEGYFPEVIRSLSIRGALIIAGGYSETGNAWRELVRSRGSENKVYVLAANEIASGGRSLIASTSRAINAERADATVGHAKATLNLTTIANRYYTYVDASTAKARTTHYYLDRRPEIYAPLSVKSASTTTLGVDRITGVYGQGSITARVSVTGVPGADHSGVVELRNGTELLATSGLSGATATFAVPTGRLGAGRAVLTATYLGSGDLTVSASDRVSVSIAKATAAIRAGLPAKAKLKAGKRPTAKIVVSAAGVTPTGAVTVRIGKRTVAGTLVDGVATVRLPKLKAGKRKAVIRYAGSADVAPQRQTVKVKVRR